MWRDVLGRRLWGVGAVRVCCVLAWCAEGSVQNQMQETTPTSWYQECDFFHAFGWDLRGEGGTWKLDAEDITVVKEDYRLGASNDPECY